MATLNELLYEVRRVAKSRQVLDEKKIRKIYKALEKKLNGFLGDTWVKYADNDGRLTMQQLKNAGQYAKFLEEIANNVDELTSSEKTAIMTIVEDTYNKAYSGMVKAVQKADVRGDLKDVVKDINVTPDVIKRAFDNNISKLTLPTILQSHRNTIIYEIQQAVNLGLMNGDRYETVAKRVNERVGVGYSKAVRIVRTETHRNIESGFNDCAREIQNGLDGSGFIYTATWRTMKDERVRPQVRYYTAKRGWVTKTPYKAVANHIKMEGQIIQVGGLFDLGNAKAPCPGMSGTANNDCNCRCFVEYEMMTEQEFNKKKGTLKANINEAKGDDLFSILPPFKGDYVQPKNIVNELNKSEIGKETLQYLRENPQLRVEINYTDEIPNLRGIQRGNNIVIYGKNTQTKLLVTQTIIHEVTHHKYDIGGDKRSEVLCFLAEELHIKSTLTAREKIDIIKEVNRLYPKLLWRES
ncbi:MAG: hypothetical protein MJ230_01750 [bacterium]|nr:hypothetical protein [bacterium]